MGGNARPLSSDVVDRRRAGGGTVAGVFADVAGGVAVFGGVPVVLLVGVGDSDPQLLAYIGDGELVGVAGAAGHRHEHGVALQRPVPHVGEGHTGEAVGVIEGPDSRSQRRPGPLRAADGRLAGGVAAVVVEVVAVVGGGGARGDEGRDQRRGGQRDYGPDECPHPSTAPAQFPHPCMAPRRRCNGQGPHPSTGPGGGGVPMQRPRPATPAGGRAPASRRDGDRERTQPS